MKTKILSAILAALFLLGGLGVAQEIGRLTFPLSVQSSAVWPFNDINVCWENPSADNQLERSWVQQAVQQSWEAHSNIDFRGWNQCQDDSGGIRIRIADEGPHTEGLGRHLSGKRDGMVLNFSFENWSPSCRQPESQRAFCIRNIAIHEFGHALGFAHEQNRSDAPLWCRDQGQGTSGDIYMTPYDPDSIMNYCNPRWNNDGMLSSHDIDGLRFWYGDDTSGIPYTPDCRVTPLLVQHANFGGERLVLYGSMVSLSPVDFNDRASSLCVPAGYRLTVFQNDNYSGARIVFDGPIAVRNMEFSAGGLEGWNDRISSIQLTNLKTGNEIYDAPPGCANHPILFQNDFFRGMRVEIGFNHVPALSAVSPEFNDRTSSVCVPSGWAIRLYYDRDFGGHPPLEIRGPAFWQRMPPGWNDEVSSVAVGIHP